MLNKYSLLFAQIIAHLGLVALVLWGRPMDWLICLFVYFCNGCLGMTVTYHRGLAHNSWPMPRWFEVFGTFCATIGMTGSAISWVAVHRKHHRYTDTEKDPHSPRYKGFIYCQWLSMFIPVEPKYVIDLVKRPLYRYQHRFYFLICGIYALILYSFNPFLLISAWLAPAAVLWNGGSLIVSCGHLFGHSHSDKDNSKNNWLLAFLVWGEGWHENHHLKQRAPAFGREWWQIDIGYRSIQLISLFKKKTSEA